MIEFVGWVEERNPTSSSGLNPTYPKSGLFVQALLRFCNIDLKFHMSFQCSDVWALRAWGTELGEWSWKSDRLIQSLNFDAMRIPLRSLPCVSNQQSTCDELPCTCSGTWASRRRLNCDQRRAETWHLKPETLSTLPMAEPIFSNLHSMLNPNRVKNRLGVIGYSLLVIGLQRITFEIISHFRNRCKNITNMAATDNWQLTTDAQLSFLAQLGLK